MIIFSWQINHAYNFSTNKKDKDMSEVRECHLPLLRWASCLMSSYSAIDYIKMNGNLSAPYFIYPFNFLPDNYNLSRPLPFLLFYIWLILIIYLYFKFIFAYFGFTRFHFCQFIVWKGYSAMWLTFDDYFVNILYLPAAFRRFNGTRSFETRVKGLKLGLEQSRMRQIYLIAFDFGFSFDESGNFGSLNIWVDLPRISFIFQPSFDYFLNMVDLIYRGGPSPFFIYSQGALFVILLTFYNYLEIVTFY